MFCLTKNVQSNVSCDCIQGVHSRQNDSHDVVGVGENDLQYFTDDDDVHVCVGVIGSLWSQAGLLLTFISLASIGAGIADVFFSYVTFCTQDDYMTACSPAGGSKYGDVLTFTWVSAGIWGSILVRAATTILSISRAACVA